MAGTRHHILPQFLLRGFPSRISGGQFFTWVQRKGGPPFETNILNALVEGKFYEGTAVDVDDAITNLESRFAPVIDGLRKESTNRVIVNSEIPELVVHLSIRTKNLRDSFFDASHYLFNGLIAHMEGPKNLCAMLRRAAKRKARWWKRIYGRAAQESRSEPEAIPNLSPTLEEQIISHIETSPEGSLSEVATIKKVIQRVMKAGHLNALSKTLVPQPRLELYRKLNWYLVKLESGTLVLGDAVLFIKLA